MQGASDFNLRRVFFASNVTCIQCFKCTYNFPFGVDSTD